MQLLIQEAQMKKDEWIRSLEQEVERLKSVQLPLGEIVFKPSQKLPGTPFAKVLQEAICKKGWKVRLTL